MCIQNQKQNKITYGNPLDSSLIQFGAGTLGEWFDYYYNRAETDALLSNKQNLITSTNKLSASYITGLSVATTSLSNMIYMSPSIASGMTLDTQLEQKQQK